MKTNTLGKKFGRLNQSVRKLGEHLTTFYEVLMANIQDLTNEIASLKQAVLDDEAADAALVEQLDAQIVDLESQLAANQPVDTQPLIDSLREIRAALSQPAAPVDETGTGDVAGEPGTGTE